MGISTSLLLQPSPYVISPSPYLHLISTCTSTSPSFPPHLPHHLYNSHFHPHLHLISTSLPPASSFLWLSAVSGTVGSFQWLLSGHCKGCEWIAQEEPTVPLFRAERREALGFLGSLCIYCRHPAFEGPGRTVFTLCQDFCEVVFLGCFVLFSWPGHCPKVRLWRNELSTRLLQQGQLASSRDFSIIAEA